MYQPQFVQIASQVLPMIGEQEQQRRIQQKLNHKGSVLAMVDNNVLVVDASNIPQPQTLVTGQSIAVNVEGKQCHADFLAYISPDDAYNLYCEDGSVFTSILRDVQDSFHTLSPGSWGEALCA